MSFIIAPENLEELQAYQTQGVSEFLIRLADFSRQGRLEQETARELTEYCLKLSLRVVIEWDILMEQFRFQEISQAFVGFIESLSNSSYIILRVQDLGAMHFCKEHFPQNRIQLNLETGHRNLPSLHKQIAFVGDQLDRVVLSFELSKDKLRLYRENLTCPLEILFHGRIPLFYSPRKLLTPVSQKGGNWIEMSGESEESPHHGFPLIENRHGTFMYNVKELSLLDVYSELQEIGIDFFRFELSAFEQQERVGWFTKAMLVINDRSLWKEFKHAYPQELIRGFYTVNRSSVLFEKLKNRHLLRDDETYIGEVVEVLKPKHIAVMVKKGELQLNDDIVYKSPEGKLIKSRLVRMVNSHNQSVDRADAGSIIFLPYVKSISARSLVTKPL